MNYTVWFLPIFAFLLYRSSIVIYRLVLHPLASIPGPKLAAVTTLYESYYDIVKKGIFTFKIRDLHEQYGPIIRIGPDEVHINDADFYDNVFSMQGVWRKNVGYKRYGQPTGHLTTIPHDLHRARRAALNPFFSKQRIMALEPVIQKHVKKLQGRLQEHAKSGRPIDVELVFSAFSMDVASEYAMGTSYGNLDMPDYNSHYHGMIQKIGPMWCVSKQLTWLPSIFEAMPDWMIRKMDKGVSAFKDFEMHCEKEIHSMMALANTRSKSKEEGPRTIFHALLQDPDLPPDEKSVDHLRHEAVTVIGAGTVTTSFTFMVILFHLAWKPSIAARLRQELKSAPGPRPLSLRELEQLPYMTAVITEALRLVPGAPGRVGRIREDSATIYSDSSYSQHEYVIPPGFEMSMTSLHISRQEKLFARPNEYIPERWSDVTDEERQRLHRYYVPFVRGTRNCLGMNLAYAELRLATAALFSGELDFELFESQADDLEIVRESGPSPVIKAENGIRMLVKKHTPDVK